MSELRAGTADGGIVRAIDEGSGPALLVVHPGGSDATSWALVAAALTSQFRVIRLRRRRYDPGATAAANYSMFDEAQDVLAIAQLLDRPLTVIGHSSGAVAALEAARLDPQAFAAVIAYEPPMPTATLVGGAAGVRARRALDATDPVEAMRIHLTDIVQLPKAEVDGLLGDPRARDYFAAAAAAQLADNDAIDGLGVGIERFRALDLPTTLIEGALSPAHLRARVADLAAVLPDARVVTLPGQGHLAHVAAPAQLADAIRDAVGWSAAAPVEWREIG